MVLIIFSIMKLREHKSTNRGGSNFGWLKSYHTFSFGNYFNPAQTHFGVLRVINDDTVSPGAGFGTHPHKDMEIISIPLSGALAHNDSMGNSGIISAGEVQVMSAGTGIRHSEMNASNDDFVEFLQIWIFPDKNGIEPRYGQAKTEVDAAKNKWNLIVGPEGSESKVWIHQDAYIHLSKFESGRNAVYTLNKSNNGVYIFVIKGSVTLDEITLNERDGVGIEEAEQFELSFNEETDILLMEVPMF